MQLVLYWIITTVTLMWGGYTDYKRREIPNAVHILLIGAGLLNSSMRWQGHLLGFFLPPLAMIIVAKILKQKANGGDVKLYASLGFNVGIVLWLAIAFFAEIFSMLFTRDKKNLPLCTQMFFGFITVAGILLGIRFF